MALVEVGNKMQNGQIEVTQPDELMQANLQLSYVLRALKRVGSLALQNHCCIHWKSLPLPLHCIYAGWFCNKEWYLAKALLWSSFYFCRNLSWNWKLRGMIWSVGAGKIERLGDNVIGNLCELSSPYWGFWWIEMEVIDELKPQSPPVRIQSRGATCLMCNTPHIDHFWTISLLAFPGFRN